MFSANFKPTFFHLKVGEESESGVDLVSESMDEHNKHYSKETKEQILALHQKMTENKVQYNGDCPLGKLLDELEGEWQGVDIGSGQGWHSNFMSHNVHIEKVWSIEPSQWALGMAKELYGSNPKIEWILGYAQDGLDKVQPTKPLVIFSGCVLSHLRDDVVVTILGKLDEKAPKGSKMALSENWGIEWHGHLWHSRGTEWWKEVLKGWDLEFWENPGSPPGVFKGIVATKR